MSNRNPVPPPRPWRPFLIIGAVVIALTVPFAGKAFNIDEPLFLWAAIHAQSHPTDPYGFDVNWYGMAEPMRQVMQNPPLTSYVIAIAASVVGWSESALHLVFALFAIAAGCGVWLLARRLTVSPWIAVAIAGFSPVFLVCALSVMSDMAMTALFICAVALWVEGLETKKISRLWIAAAFAAASGLFKYFGTACVPLLAVYTVAKERKVGRSLVPLALPVVAFSLYDIAGRMTSGRGLFTAAARYAATANQLPAATFVDRLSFDLAYAGACIVAAVVVIPFLLRRSSIVWIAPSIVVGLVGGLRLHAAAPRIWGPVPPLTAVQFALAVAGGAAIVLLAVRDLYESRSPESLLILLWLAGTIVFAGFINWTLAARSLLPVVAPAAIVLARALSRDGFGWKAAAIPLAISLVISIMALAADSQLANASRTAAREISAKYVLERRPIWFEGHWGFQYYMGQLGGEAYDTRRSTLHENDYWITPANDTLIFPEKDLPSNGVIETIEIRSAVPVAVMSRERRAGFYSYYVGPLPYLFTSGQVERFIVRRLGEH